MKKEMTSEEKLLKLIRSKEKTVDSLDSNGIELSWNPKILKQGGQFSGHDKEGIEFLPFANRFLVILILGIAMYFFVRFFLLEKKEEGNLVLEIERTKPSALTDLSLTERKPFSFYQERIQQRDIFQSPWEKPEEVLGSAPEALDFRKKLKLIGIVLDGDPKAIVEDMETRQTLFMSEGETIKNAVLQEIREDRAIFILNDETMELTR